MRDRNRDLSELETLDTGKSLQETLVADAASGADALEYFAGFAPTVTGQTIPLGRGHGVYFARAFGRVCRDRRVELSDPDCRVESGARFGLRQCTGVQTVEVTPLSALALAEILTEAGLPAGLFNVVQGAGDVGAALVKDPRVAKVSLTGSVPTGRKVYAQAAEGIRAVTMELGGKSPLIVFDDADLDNAVGAAMLGNFYSSGQICTNGTRVFVARSVLEPFLEKLAARTGRIVMGDPLDEATQMGPLVSEAQAERVMDYIARGVAEGARLVCGGKSAGGWFVEPTVFADVTDDMTIAREEIFGPVMSVLVFDDEAEVIARANATEYGLAAGGVHPRSDPRASGRRAVAGGHLLDKRL